ncbi:MAG: DUF1934 domain-containing protein [Erysipelotrichales bacterium]
MSKVDIDFHSFHTNENGNEDIKYNVEADARFEDGFEIIEFDEPMEDAKIKCIIRYNSNELHLIREGDFSSEMHFYKSEKSFGMYDVMGYTIDLNLGLRNLEINNMKLHIEYDLIVNQINTGNFKINININRSE